MKKQKELSDFMDMTKKHEGELTEKSDHVILEKLRAEGYKDLDTQNLFEIFYNDDKIREKIMNEIELQTDGDLQKISQRKESLLKALDDLLLETYQMEPALIDEARLVTGEEGCVCNIDIEMIENGQKSGLFDSKKFSENYNRLISTELDLLKRWNAITDVMLKSANLPTKQEIEEIYEELHTLKSRISKLESSKKKA